MPALPERLSNAARRELETLGVRVLTEVPVTEVTADAPRAANISRQTSWCGAAGVRATPIAGKLGTLELTRTGQILTTPTLRSVSDPRVFAIGDCASCTLPGSERPGFGHFPASSLRGK
ncbi:FAD-dependent oxidoreductase [Novosphingobium resinovorum]|uniref:FAD-dependent oxidoreductase n=1 Tax=Novosphingobium resinovorum TaxID=158500 RepID=UPI0039B74BA7